MKYQESINHLDNTPNRSSKFRTKNWVETNDDSHRMYNSNSKSKFKTSVLKFSLCDYGDTYILVKGTILFTGEGADAPARQADGRDKRVIFKHHSLTA